MKKYIWFCLAFILLIGGGALLVRGAMLSNAAPELSDGLPADPVLANLAYEAGEGASVSLQQVPGEDEYYFLFLPSSADLTALTLHFDGGPATIAAERQSLNIASGSPFDLTALCPAAPTDGVCQITFSQDSLHLPIKIMVSQNIGSMYITSADPVNKGRDYVESVKGNKGSGQVTLLRSDGFVVYTGGLSQIKGRGNSTWHYVKKPYQIKLEEKSDLLDNGEAAKTWILLANYYDKTTILNSLTYDLAAEMGLAYSPNHCPVDLYYDGEYRGSYLLCEKTEIGDARVEINDLEKDFEDANPQIDDFDGLLTVRGTNAYGNAYQYVDGLHDPASITGGYLLEIDYDVRAEAEKSFFTTTQGYYIVSKSPEYLSQNAIEYISGFYQEFEDAVFNGGVNPTTGKSYTDYVDLESLAKCYLILELSQDGDAFLSSTFFYKPADEDKLYAGPVWDFDSAYGGYGGEVPKFTITEMVAGATPIGNALLKIPSFRQAVEGIYQRELNQLITEVALRSDPEVQAGHLRSIGSYIEEITASWQMNDILYSNWTGPKDLAAAAEKLQSFLSRRNQLMCELQWSKYNAWFTDVSWDAWYFSAVNDAVDNGLFIGSDANRFSPDSAMTRAMVWAALGRMAGADVDGTGDEWYAKAQAWASASGISNGAGPNGIVTREELATMLWRYAGCPAVTDGLGQFSDYRAVAGWASDAMQWAVSTGVIAGDHGRLNPRGDAMRSEAAAIFMRFCENIA